MESRQNRYNKPDRITVFHDSPDYSRDESQVLSKPRVYMLGTHVCLDFVLGAN